jgi:hypothetical protein
MTDIWQVVVDFAVMAPVCVLVAHAWARQDHHHAEQRTPSMVAPPGGPVEALPVAPVAVLVPWWHPDHVHHSELLEVPTAGDLDVLVYGPDWWST